METKVCKTCGCEKGVNEFYQHKSKIQKQYVLYPYCKKCCNAMSKKWREKNKKYVKEYRRKYFLKNKEQISIDRKGYMKSYYEKNKTQLREKNKEYYNKKRPEKIEYQKKYYQEHKEEKANYDKIYRELYKFKKNKRELEKLHNDNIYHLKQQLRSCIYKSFKKKSYYKKDYTQTIIGCGFDYFINYILQTYKNNYGIEWDGIEKVHIDHIIPLATAKTEDDVIKLCHYTNLQLLKARDNLIKNAKLNYNGGDIK